METSGGECSGSSDDANHLPTCSQPGTTIARYLRRIVLLGPPLALAAIELTHPAHVAHNVVSAFFPVAGWWFVLHIIQFVLFALLSGSLFLLTADCRGVATITSRFATAVFVIFYNLGDAVIGVAAGALGRNANQLAHDAQSGRAEAISVLFNEPVINGIYIVGRAAWFVALLSAAVAIVRYRRAPVPAVFFALSGVLLAVFDHPGLFGSLAFASFFVGAVILDAGSPRRARWHKR
jgi:hypothetical protein